MTLLYAVVLLFERQQFGIVLALFIPFGLTTCEDLAMTLFISHQIPNYILFCDLEAVPY